MMGFNGWGMMGGSGGAFSLFGLLTWLAILAFLVAGARYFWKKADKK